MAKRKSKNEQEAERLYQLIKDDVDALLILKANADVLRKKVDAIQTALLATGDFDTQNVKVRDPKLAYHLEDEPAQRYYKALDAKYKEAGFTNLPEGHCPALIAEQEVIQKEHAIIKKVEPLTGVSNDKLLLGTKDMNGYETRKKWLDLLTGLVVKHPSRQK